MLLKTLVTSSTTSLINHFLGEKGEGVKMRNEP